MDKNEYTFIEKNKKEWECLDFLINQKKKSFAQVLKLGSLYLKATEDFSYAKTTFPASETFVYLNNLIRRCHLIFHRMKTPRLLSALYFLGIGFPKILFKLQIPILISFLIMVSSGTLSFYMVSSDPELAEMFVDSRTYEMVRNDLTYKEKFGNFDNIPEDKRVALSFNLWFHNSRVSIMVFVLGITLGIGSVLLLFYNGCMLGALLAIYYMNGYFADFVSTILVHGSIELIAIVIAGGAALNLAQAILLPGRKKRGKLLTANGKTAFLCIIGVIFLLLIAGLIEGLITPMKLPVPIRFSIAGVNFVLLTLYAGVGAFFSLKEKRELQMK